MIELVEGPTLADAASRKDPFPSMRRLPIAHQVAGALALTRTKRGSSTAT